MKSAKTHIKYFAVVSLILLAQTTFAGRSENKASFQDIQQNDPAAVQKALGQGADPNAMSLRGRPMTSTIKGGNNEIIILLADAGAQGAPKSAGSAPVEPKKVAAKKAPSTQVETKPVVVQSPADAATVAKAQQLLATGEMKKLYNAIVVDYLVNEGKNRLPPELKKAALDQLVAALISKTEVSKDEQLTMALGALTGIAIGAANNDVISDAGGDVESSYASEWDDWIDSAFNLIHAGYAEDAAKFFEFGMVNIPYPNLKARCVKGFALARPNQAYDFLMNKMETSNDPAYKAVALPLLGILASAENMPADKKEAILKVLTDNTGMMAGPEGQRAAMHGLENMNDPRAAEVMTKFTSGMTVDKWVKRAAIRGLLLTYKDQSMVEILDKMANAGSFSMTDDFEKVWAGLLLIEAQTPPGYTWAEMKLTPKRKNLFAPEDKAGDPSADIVRLLVKYGGVQGKDILAKVITKYKDNDWMKTWIATGLLEFHDTTHIALVKASLNNPEWDYTAVRIVEALAANDDYSGLPVLEQLIQKTPPTKSGAMKVMGTLAGKKDDTQDKERQLANLRIQIAEALARINVDDCVPLLAMLLNDKDYYVRSTAALALTEMTRPSALDGQIKAMSIDYGQINGMPRSPNVQAHVVRISSMRFPKDPRTAEIQKLGAKAPYAAVQFISVVEQ